MKEVELINKRKPREKHFLQEDGTIVAKIYDSDIHYKKNGKYEEIDNTLINSNGSYCNKENDFKVYFRENTENELMRMEKDNCFLAIKLEESKKIKAHKRVKQERYSEEILYDNILDGINVEYQVLGEKVKETIVLNNKKYKNIYFEIDTNLILIEENNKILAKNEEKVVFTIERPYMTDSKGKTNYNIFYKLISKGNNYKLELCLDKEWLKDKDTVFPVYIDPTITSNNQELNIQDTYIYPGDNTANKNNQDFLKAGIERINGVNVENRALIKFDLPDIGTGSEIVDATIFLYGYPSYDVTNEQESKLASIHRVTEDWSEQNATWEQMSGKYDEKVEAIFECYRSPIEYNTINPYSLGATITRLVKSWYRDISNYGIMIKPVNTNYIDDNYQSFFSKNNSINSSVLKPVISITYKNQNGLENYLDYKIQKFSDGIAYVNTFNGNMTTIFNLGNTKGGKLPINLNLIYNSNDVVLNNNTFFGKGYKLNYEQTIKDNDNEYLEYMDADGTIHYFYPINLSEQAPTTYQDEDGLNLTLEKSDTICTISNKQNNEIMTFTKNSETYYLTEIKDADNNTINIQLNENNRINKLADKYNAEITIDYNSDLITIISPTNEVNIHIANGKIVSIVTIKGNTTFEYNENDLISSIKDITGIKMNYEYYDKKPYRMKKITQLGLENTVGQSFVLEYGFDTTRITTNSGRTETIIYNYQGNVLSRNSLKSNDDIMDAYSLSQSFNDILDNTNNKINLSQIPVGHIKNYLKNTSFESETNYFASEEGIECNISSENSYYGNNSLKIVSQEAEKSVKYKIDVPKGKFYTMSGFLKNDNDVQLILSYIDSEGNEVSSTELCEQNEEFEREDISIYFDENANGFLNIIIKLLVPGTTYLDNIQLEEGQVANLYNFIENSDFSEGYSDWDCGCVNQELEDSMFEVVKFNNDQNTALKVNMDPIYGSSFGKVFPVNGKKGDLFTVSFWYKNEGIPEYRPHGGTYTIINFHPVDGETEYCFGSSPNLNSNDTIWQYYSYSDYALEDFDKVYLSFVQQDQANSFYITNISFNHNITSGFYDYDQNGNLVKVQSQNGQQNILNYNENNKLTSVENQNGNNVKYEYDKEKTDRVLSVISSNGVSNKFTYDSNGNRISTKTSRLYNQTIESDNYKIRAKGTNKYIKAELNLVLLEENDCSNTIWLFENNVETNEYIIKYAVNPSYMISCDNNMVTLDTSKINSMYLEKNEDDGSYSIVVLDNGVKYLKVEDGQLTIDSIDQKTDDYRFYIELPNQKFIENNTVYTDDQKYVESTVDSSLKTTNYTVNTNGMVEAVINPKNTIINYSYNDKNQLSSATIGNKIINYTYDNGLPSSIQQGNIIYNIKYDKFLNKEKILIGENKELIRNIYGDNNGNLMSAIYGNNQQISFLYDDYDRIKTITRMDDVYNIKYNNNGNLAKILSNNHIKKYDYDSSNRVYKFRDNNFNIKYSYDENNNVVRQKYKLDNTNNIIENTYESDGSKTKTTFGDKDILYYYDDLGRLMKKTIFNNYDIEYKYEKYGKRTSNIVEEVQTTNSHTRYKYDEMNNIESIYIDDQHIQKFYYDIYNELIKEENFSDNKVYEFTYDNNGNIISKCIRKLDTNETIENYVYEYNDTDWKDLLTKYDGKNILYDDIGNPVSIDNNITFEWTNGRHLKKYIDTQNNIVVDYKYNLNDVRESKIVNGTEIKYYMEDNRIIYEQKDNQKIYYLYDQGELVGLKQNENTYIYEKNLQGDITGIIDSNTNLIVTYKYDSWGKILSIKDANGDEITDVNNIGLINPFRYRGYYYDSETSLYYLNDRYYNPDCGRFINADGTICSNKDIISTNLFIYASNNPTNYIDSSGCSWKSFLKKFIKKTPIYKAVKTIITIASNAYLAIKDYTVSKDMFNKAMYNPTGNISTKTQKEIKEKSKNSTQVQNGVNKCIKDNKDKNSFSGCVIDDAEMSGDLYYSIQHVDIAVSGEKISKNTWDINISMSDVYDFTEWRSMDSFGGIVNNLGYVMQKIGMLDDYTWSVSYNITYTEQDD